MRLQGNENPATPSRLYSAADLEAGPAPPRQDAASEKQMDDFFKEVAAIKVTACPVAFERSADDITKSPDKTGLHLCV